jgi:nitrilase
VQIHIASWPAEFEMPDPEKQPWLYHETGEASYRASQFMAIEGQTFVLVASQIITEENLEKNNLLGNHVTKTVRARLILLVILHGLVVILTRYDSRVAVSP